MEVINTIGRRKAAIARVYLSEGKGQITVNNRDFKDYFPDKQLHYIVEQPLVLLELQGTYDIKVNLDGGGMAGQAEALRLGISRALIKVNPDYKTALRAEGFVTRDPRVVERKKPGQPKARKRFQFSKR
jgi:small subunit ribosomal protein S9